MVDREREVTQIGRGSFAAGRLRRDAIQRTIEALTRFARLARRHQVDRILCTATAAVREARNGGEFLKAARSASGVSPRVIPTEEEGRLIYLAVKSALQLPAEPQPDRGHRRRQRAARGRAPATAACARSARRSERCG